MTPLFQRYINLKYGSVYFWGVEIFDLVYYCNSWLHFWGIETHHSVYLSFFSECVQLMALYMCEVLQLMTIFPHFATFGSFIEFRCLLWSMQMEMLCKMGDIIVCSVTFEMRWYSRSWITY